MRELPLIDTMPKDENTKVLGQRKGTPIEKGIVITAEKMERSMNGLKKKLAYYSAYPDMFVDEVLIPSGSSFNLLFTQRIILRNVLRCSSLHLTAARGFSKTFTCVLGFFIKAIIQPGSRLAISAPTKSQAEAIGKEKIDDILYRFPILEKEIKNHTLSKGNVRVTFRNGSFIEITAALETTRGRRFHGLMCDELRDQDGDMVNTILLPTLSDSRKTVGRGLINPHEPGNTAIFTTSASSKSSYNYEKVVDSLIKSIIAPGKTSVIGLDYRIPILEKLIPASFVRDLKLDPTFNPSDFAREYLSIYTSDNEESWFNFDQMNKHRKILGAEWSAKYRKGLDIFYLMSVDVGRLNDQTVVTVFKVIDSNGTYKTRIVNIFVLGRTSTTKQFVVQAADLKELIRAFNPVEVIIDTNGLGISLADQMILPQMARDGTELPPLGFHNDDEYKKIQPVDAPRILYSFKANPKLNSQMHGNAYSRISSGTVDFLVSDQEAKRRLLASKVGQKMKLDEKAKALMPYEMTTKLFEEMGNLRLKRTGANMDIALERINTRFPKDKFSSLEMGLWRIKMMEESAVKKQRKKRGKAKLVYYGG